MLKPKMICTSNEILIVLADEIITVRIMYRNTQLQSQGIPALYSRHRRIRQVLIEVAQEDGVGEDVASVGVVRSLCISS